MDAFDQVATGIQRISDQAQLRDHVFYANQAARERCGSCLFWMKSRECPREKNVNGMSRGPSCDASVCSKFQVTASSTKFAAQKRRDANEFAVRHGLAAPFPSALHAE